MSCLSGVSRSTSLRHMIRELPGSMSWACFPNARCGFRQSRANLAHVYGSRLSPPWVGLVAALMLLLVGCSRQSTRPDSSKADSPSGATRAGRTLRLKATTEAVRSSAILAPLLSGEQIGNLTIIKLIPSGALVKPGDLLHRKSTRLNSSHRH